MKNVIASPPVPNHQRVTTSDSPTRPNDVSRPAIDFPTNPPSKMGGRWFRLCRFNPPAHPEDERRRARSLPIPYPFPHSISFPNPSLPASASPSEAYRLADLFSGFFFLSKFSSQIPAFFDFFSISGRPGVDFWPFLLPKQVPGGYFFGVFFENGDFVKIVLPLWREHNFEGSDPPKFGSGSDSEQRRRQRTKKIASGVASGRTFSAPGPFLVHFGSILGSKTERRHHAFWSFF